MVPELLQVFLLFSFDLMARSSLLRRRRYSMCVVMQYHCLVCVMQPGNETRYCMPLHVGLQYSPHHLPLLSTSLLPLFNTSPSSSLSSPFCLPPFFISQAIPRSLTHYPTVPLPSSSHPPLTDSIRVPVGEERGEGSNSSAPLLLGSLTTSPQNETLIGKVRRVSYRWGRRQVVYCIHALLSTLC